MNRTLSALGATIFDVMSRRAQETGAINLGQGFPEDDGPLALRQAAATALIEGPNQYPPMRGLPALRTAIAEHYARHQGVTLDPLREVAVTSGATEALAAACLAMLNPGDEAILFEPAYDAYRPLLERAGAVVRTVGLAPPHWRIPDGALEAAFTAKTRVVIVNTPHNPAAALLHADDRARLARLAEAHDAIVVSDEVWEHITFDGHVHDTLLADPILRHRTIKIGSAGKMFGFTGWKVGFVCAAPPLLDLVVKAHQFLTFTTPPNLQTAAAAGLAYPPAFFAQQRADLARSRDRLVAALHAEGFVTTPSRGTYFLLVDLAASGIAADDATFCTRAVDEAGVAAIPLSAFTIAQPETGFVRLCFAKRDETLDRGAERLSKARRLFV